MTQAAVNKNIERSAREMRILITRSKRKLIEMETLLSISEIKHGKSETFKNAQALLKALS